MISRPDSVSKIIPLRFQRYRALGLVSLMIISSLAGIEFASWKAIAVSDADGDGLSYGLEYLINTQPQDPDSDNDGLPDGWEWMYGLNPNDGSSIGGDGATGDPDGDGMTNLQEYNYLQPNNWDLASTTQLLDNGVWWNGTVPVRNWDEENAMQYSQPSCGDPGSDGTGSIILCDEDPVGNICTDGIDNDRDGQVDSNDNDYDGDADCSSDDDDGDGIDDEDVDGWDTDGDGLPDGWEAANGLNATSPSNNDGYYGDPDGDGLINIYEYINPSWTTQCSGVDCWRPGPSTAAMTETVSPCDPVSGIGPNGCATMTAEVDGIMSTDPQSADTDGDGLNDSYEALTLLTDPTSRDTDNDGVDDGVEVSGAYGNPPQASDPRNNNTDGDAFTDGEEDLNGNGVIDVNETDPTRREDSDDFDNDGIQNWAENMTCTLWNVADTDGGGVNDGDERNTTHNTDPCDSMINWVETNFTFNGGTSRLTVGNGSGFNPAGGMGYYNDSSGTLTSFAYSTVVNNVIYGVSNGPAAGTVSVEHSSNSWCHTSAVADGSIFTWRDFCDDDYEDTDGDGLADWQELLGTFGFFSNPFLVDSDLDGVSDYDEVMNNTDPTEPCWNNLDSDGDGINDYFETSTGCDLIFIGILNGSTDGFSTNPQAFDTDQGGIDDRQEYFDGTNPEADPTDDIHLMDTDGDGIPDEVENNTGTDWRNPDTDGGGVIDGVECPRPFWFTNCVGSPTDPLDPTDDITENQVVFWANNTTGQIDLGQPHYWRLTTGDNYTGSAYASLPEAHSSNEIFVPYADLIHLPDSSFANDSVTWQVNFNNGVMTGAFPVPSLSSNITFWFDSAVQVSRTNETHSYEVIAGVLSEYWSVQSEYWYDTTAQANALVNSSSTYELDLPGYFTDMTTPESVVYNITNGVITDSGATTPWEKATALADFLVNGNATTEFKINFNGSLVPDGVDIAQHMLILTQEGTCSEFTTLYTTMARLAGLPTRKVSGYKDGFWQETGFEIWSQHFTHWAEINFVSTPGSGSLDMGWVPVEACPPAATMEVVNLTASPLTWDRDGSSQFNVTGQLRFVDNQTIAGGETIEAFLQPYASASAPTWENSFGAASTDANGTFTITGIPSEAMLPGFGVLVFRPFENGYVAESAIVTTAIVNVTDDVNISHLLPAVVNNPVVGAGATTTVNGLIMFENVPENGVGTLANLTMFLEYSSSVQGTVNLSTQISPEGFWSFDLSLDSTEPLGNLSSSIWFPGWTDTSMVVAGSPAYNLRPLAFPLMLNVSEAPNLSATLEGPGANNSIIIVDDLFYINGSAISRGPSPVAMDGMLEFSIRQNGTGGLYNVVLNQSVNGTFSVSANMSALLAVIPAGLMDVRLRFYPTLLEATDDANMSGPAWWLKGFIRIEFQSNPAMRGGQTSVILDFYDHRDSNIDLNLTGDFSSSFNGTWFNTSTNPAGTLNLIWNTSASLAAGDYPFETIFNGSEYFAPVTNSTLIRIQADVSITAGPGVDWVHIGDIGWINGSFVDAQLLTPVLNNNSGITVIIIHPTDGPYEVGSTLLNTSTGNFSVNFTMPNIAAGVYTAELVVDFQNGAPPGGPYYNYIGEFLPSTQIGVESDAILSIADVPPRLQINDTADLIIHVVDGADNSNVSGAVVNYVFDFGNSNTSIGQATSDPDGNATLTWLAAGFDPGSYVVRFWMANDTTDTISTPNAARYIGNETSMTMILQAPTIVNLLSIPTNITAGMAFNVSGVIMDNDNLSRPLSEAVNIDIYWADNPEEKLINNRPTTPNGTFSFSVPTDSSGNGTTRGNHDLIIEVVNNSSPYYLTANTSHPMLIFGVTDFEGMQPLNAVIVNRGDSTNISTILVEASDQFTALDNFTVAMRFDETWMSAEEMTDGNGRVTFNYSIPFDQPLGLINATFFFNGSVDLLSKNKSLTSITVRSLTFMVVDPITANPVAGTSFNVSGSIQSDNGTALMSRDGTPLIANILFKINDQLGNFVVANGIIQANGNWTAMITLNSDFAAGSHNLSASYVPAVNFYQGSEANTTFDSRGYSTLSFIFPALDQFNNPSLNSRTIRGDSIDVYVLLVDNTLAPIDNATINLTFDGLATPISGTTWANGSALISLLIPANATPGFLDLSVSFDGTPGTTGILGSSQNTTMVVIANTTTNITSITQLTVVGDTISINGTLLDDLGMPLEFEGEPASGLIHLLVDGVEVMSTMSNATTGQWTFTYQVPLASGAGAHNVQVTYNSDSVWGNPGSVGADQMNPPFYLPSESNGIFNVSVPTEVRLAIAGGEVDREDMLVVNGSLVDIVGLPLDNRTIEVWLGGALLTNVTTDANGAFSVIYPVPADSMLGPNTLVFEFRGATWWLPSNTSGTWNIYSQTGLTVSTQATAAIGDVVAINGTVTDNQLIPVSNHLVEIYIDGILIGQVASDESGMYSLDWSIQSSFDFGEHTIFATAAQQGWYREGQANTTIWIAHRTGLIINFVDTPDATRGELWELTGQLYDDDSPSDEGISGQLLTIFYDGDEVGTVLTTGGGSWVYTIQVPMDASRGEHSFTVEFEGDTAYLGSSGEITGRAWANVVFEIDVISPQATRSSNADLITMSGRLREVGGNQELLNNVTLYLGEGTQCESDSEVRCIFISTANWNNGGFTLAAMAPIWMEGGINWITLQYLGDSNEYFNGVSSNNSVAIVIDATFDLSMETIVVGDSEKENVRGLLIITADDTNAPLQGVRVWVELIVPNGSDRLEEKTSDELGAVLIAFDSDPAYADVGQWGRVQLRIYSEDNVLSEASRAQLEALYAGEELDYNLGASDESTSIWTWIFLVLVAAAIAGGVIYARKKKMDALSEIEDVFTYTAELLAAGDAIREAIFQCYEGLCQVLQSHGFLRHDFETVREFEIAIRSAVPIREDALLALDQVFEVARYSRKEMGDAHKVQAQQALQACQSEVERISNMQEIPNR